MRGKLAFSCRQIAEQELAALDIGRPGRRDRVDADRKKAVSFGGDKPPSALPLFGAKEACRTEGRAQYQPAEAIALRRLREPLGEFLRFFGAPRPEHLDRRDLFAPAAGVELAEAVDDALIHHAPRLAWRRHAQRADHQLPRGRWPCDL